MPRITPLQSSFAAGELSPRLYRRYDLGGFQQGTKVLRNFIPIARGPAKSRDGFRHLGQVAPFPGEVAIVTTEELVISTPSVDVEVTDEINPTTAVLVVETPPVGVVIS